MLGLTGPQVITVATVVVVATVGLNRGLPAPVALTVLIAGSGLGIVRTAGTPLIHQLPTVWRWTRTQLQRERAWTARLPLGAAGTDLPPALAGHVLLAIDPGKHDHPGRIAPIAVLHHRKTRLVSATLRAGGRQFCLLDPHEQDRLLAGWADALRPFCRERNPIGQFRWSEWAAPAGVSEHQGWLDEQPLAPSPAVDTYRALLAAAGPLATRHETLLTLTVRTDRVPVEARHHHDRTAAAIEYLVRELRLLGQRLEQAGITVHGALAPTQLVRAVRVRLDPTAIATVDALDRSLSDRAGTAVDLEGITVAARTSWRRWQTDDSVHRSFHIRAWPRNQLPAGWLTPLLLHAGITRTVTVAYQPVAPTASRRAVHRQAAKIESDAQHRAEKGFRVGAEHRWAARAVADREEELTAGHTEFAYTGIVDVAAADREQLERDCTALIQAAASAGIELRPLNGQHDLAVTATLPLAAGLTARTPW
jgi:hypothetical protein